MRLNAGVGHGQVEIHGQPIPPPRARIRASLGRQGSASVTASSATARSPSSPHCPPGAGCSPSSSSWAACFLYRALALIYTGGTPIFGLPDEFRALTNPLLGENATARIAQRNLLDAIIVAVAQRDRKAADQNLDRTRRAVQSKRRL